MFPSSDLLHSNNITDLRLGRNHVALRDQQILFLCKSTILLSDSESCTEEVVISPRVLRLLDESLAIAPILSHLDPALQVYLDLEKVFKLVTRGAGRLFEHSSALADDNALVRLSRAVNNRIDIEDVRILSAQTSAPHRQLFRAELRPLTA